MGDTQKQLENILNPFETVIHISKPVKALTFDYLNSGSLIIKESRVIITSDRLIFRMKNGNFLGGYFSNFKIKNVANKRMEIEYNSLDSKRWFLNSWDNHWGKRAIKSSMYYEDKNGTKWTEMEGEFTIFLPSYPLTHLKRVATGRTTGKDHYEAGHFTEEIFCRFNFTEGKTNFFCSKFNFRIFQNYFSSGKRRRSKKEAWLHARYSLWD